MLVCLGSQPVFVCNTTEGGLLWETSNGLASSNFLYDGNDRESPRMLGIFTLHRDGIDKVVNGSITFARSVNSTAVLNDPVVSSHDGVTLKCFEDSNTTKSSEVTLSVGKSHVINTLIMFY